ncbi:MAG: hypothetical protein KBT33_13200 [Prevotellaceae bacterium]|nr:hypothetical protein [Candidatus Minthosoma equi]
MKKKNYEKPQVEIIEVKQAEIICRSGGYNEGPVTINNGTDIIFDEENF